MPAAGARGAAAVRVYRRFAAWAEEIGLGARTGGVGGVSEVPGDGAEFGVDREISNVEV